MWQLRTYIVGAVINIIIDTYHQGIIGVNRYHFQYARTEFEKDLSLETIYVL
jgi:hypothetical protein